MLLGGCYVGGRPTSIKCQWAQVGYMEQKTTGNRLPDPIKPTGALIMSVFIGALASAVGYIAEMVVSYPTQPSGAWAILAFVLGFAIVFGTNGILVAAKD